MNESSIRSGTITGTIFSLLAIVGWTEITKTVVLGGIGAAVSFIVSWTLRKILKESKEPVKANGKEKE
jgi:hypothetical protein